MAQRIIIAPHIDDDVLGCGGIMDKNTHVIYCGMDENHIDGRPSKKERLKEAKDTSNFLKHKFTILKNKVKGIKKEDPSHRPSSPTDNSSTLIYDSSSLCNIHTKCFR